MDTNNDVPSITSGDSAQLAQRLADVEVLYLLSFQPLRLKTLTQTLGTTFQLSAGRKAVSELLVSLEAEGLVASFRKESDLDDSSNELFGITPKGLRRLRVYVDSISAMALTMQLGLNQKLVRG